MRPCTRVGVDITMRCQQKCAHCFYRHKPGFHRAHDVPLWNILQKIERGRRGGMDHVVMVGYGEPSLCPNVPHIMRFAHERGMATSMITNGATGLSRFQEFFAQGLDHLHISSNGLDGTLDRITGQPGAFAKQAELKQWLRQAGLPFRTNVTLMRETYTELPELAAYECEAGVYHFVLLGFLPHYEWRDHVHTIAVHPAELRPYIEDACEVLLRAGVLFTIRYHPFCHLSPKYWRYVVNARYVAFDPWEWNYLLQATDLDELWDFSVRTGESVANRCDGCLARHHCGGWNRTYAAAFGGAGLAPIRDIPDEYAGVWHNNGGLHELNPANLLTGTIREKPQSQLRTDTHHPDCGGNVAPAKRVVGQPNE